MKKGLILLILLISVPLIAQDAADIQEKPVVFTGLVLAVENDSINFEERWFPTSRPTSKYVKPITIIDIDSQPIGHENLKVPFFAELTVEFIDDEAIPIKIKVLKQYRYDSDGFIRETREK